ncbi:MAG: tRNA (adenosine(37)-N6)-threonylcarbamoyltransferase complex transferase subunit TsaD [Chthoniobacterales bacterium]
MTILAIETSCDETAVAILRDTQLLASEVASQTQHDAYGGVVPEVASRSHLVHAPRLLEHALGTAGVALDEIDAFAATSGPGLASSLMIGASIAKGLALGANKPYLAVNHLEGHLLSPFFGSDEIERNISLIVSGGHTLLVEVRGVNGYCVLGRTVDDAAGEAFDKVAKLLGLGYPGGSEIESRAVDGNAARFDFPRSMLDSGDHNFSFSGLKTAVRYRFAEFKTEERTPQLINDMCASFQCAVIEVLATKSVRAAKECGAALLTMSGGVSCNQALRKELALRCGCAGLQLLVAPPRLCTDNAAMIAFAAALRLRTGQRSNVIEEIDPNLALV